MKHDWDDTVSLQVIHDLDELLENTHDIAVKQVQQLNQVALHPAVDFLQNHKRPFLKKDETRSLQVAK